MRLIPYNIFYDTFDIVIIGGGINGAGIALDAVTRGFKTLVIEKNDFGSGMTSYSTKLIHGGLQYLSNFEVGLVRESLREREILLKNAPHLIKPIQFNFPIYKNSPKSYRELRTALLAYDLLSYDKSLQNHKIIKSKPFIQIEPEINSDNLLAGAIFYDCLVLYPERLCLDNILMAEKYGAIVLNHCEVVNIITKRNKISAVIFRDNLSGLEYKVLCKVVINVTGPWVDSIIKLILPDSVNKIGGNKGTHIVVEKNILNNNIGYYFFSYIDGKPIFVIPWKNYYLIGTADEKFDGNIENIRPSRNEVDYIIKSVNFVLPNMNLKEHDIIYAYSGIRPLPYVFDLPDEDITRKYLIYDHEKNDKIFGLISLIGGQITTYRSLAKETVNLICEKLNKRIRKIYCKTDKISFFGNKKDIDEFNSIEDYILYLTRKYKVDNDTKIHLFTYYGFRAFEILDFISRNERFQKKITEDLPDLVFQIYYSINREHAYSLVDLMFRRTTLGTSKNFGINAVNFVVDEMSKIFKWDNQKKYLEIKKYEQFIESRFKYN